MLRNEERLYNPKNKVGYKSTFKDTRKLLPAKVISDSNFRFGLATERDTVTTRQLLEPHLRPDPEPPAKNVNVVYKKPMPMARYEKSKLQLLYESSPYLQNQDRVVPVQQVNHAERSSKRLGKGPNLHLTDHLPDGYCFGVKSTPSGCFSLGDFSDQVIQTREKQTVAQKFAVYTTMNNAYGDFNGGGKRRPPFRVKERPPSLETLQNSSVKDCLQPKATADYEKRYTEFAKGYMESRRKGWV